MIVREFYRQRKDGVNLYVTYSDKNLKIKKVGTTEIYDKAVDIETSGYVYIETNEPIEETDVKANE